MFARACIEPSPGTLHYRILHVPFERYLRKAEARNKMTFCKGSVMDAELHREFNARNLFNSISAYAPGRERNCGRARLFRLDIQDAFRVIALHFF